MDSDNIFTLFCKYVDETIFSDERKGEVVAFIVDQTYINDFCKLFHIKDDDLLRNARHYLYQVTHNSLLARGMIALQIFAATKRANSEGITERNYNNRLVDLLFNDLGDLQRWYADYQDDMWQKFYAWCDSNNFQVSKKCSPGWGPGRYQQYPLLEARRVFTTEALLNFARAFVDNNLTPEDDFSYNTFWELISWRELRKYIDSTNASRVYEDFEFEDDAKQQIYNFFLRWDGEYRIANYSEKKRKVASYGNILYLSQDFECADVRGTNGNLIASYPIVSLKYSMLINGSNHLAIRNRGVFIFKFDKDYQVWEETRFVEAGEEGIAMVFPDSTQLAYRFRNCELLLQCPRVQLYKITEYTAPDFCFTERRTCYLEGGLRVGRNMYLVGGAPYLIREKLEQVRVDKEPVVTDKERTNLNYLKSGAHVVSIPGRKSIKFELVEPKVENLEWTSKFAQWMIDKRKVLWQSSSEDDGIIGLDFSAISQSKQLQKTELSSSRVWAESFLNKQTDSDNTVIQTLNNIRKYGAF